MGGKLIESVNRWFERFEINYTLNPKSLGDEIVGHLFSLNLIDRISKVEIGSSDVGFGVGQLMPILVEGLSSSSKTILVEQPEIHLHPKLQGHLADFFAETSGAAKARAKGPTNQWIVETHSEALITRLQRRIREGTVAAGNVSVLYVRPATEGGARIDLLRLDRNGDFIDEWPEGFFEERLADLLY
jgi:predicted ATPase